MKTLKMSKQKQDQLKKWQAIRGSYQKWEAALQQSESRYQSILEASNTGVWEIDSHRQMDRLSNTFFTYLGYDPADQGDGKEDREECLEAGMDGLLAKPFVRDQLEEVVRRFGK